LGVFVIFAVLRTAKITKTPKFSRLPGESIMSNSFTITTPTNSILLDLNRRSQATFTVSNISGRATRGRARLVPQSTISAPWLALGGAPERDFPIASTLQYSVAVTVPPTAPPGSYIFRLDMVGVENPDEDLSQGPGVTFEVSVLPVSKFPWWIIIAAGVTLLVVIGIITALVLNRKATVPDVSGITQAAAERQLQADGFKLGNASHQNSGVIPKDLVIGSDPPGGDKVDPGATVTLFISDGPSATRTPTATLTPVATITPTATNTKTVVSPPTGLIAHYPLNSSPNEATNRTTPMTLVNAPFTLGGVSCNGIYENAGNPAFCKIASPQLNEFNYASFSISARFNPAEVKRMPVFMGGSSFRWIGFYLLENGHVGLLFNNSQFADCGATYTPGTWYNATVTYNGSAAKVYLDNTLVCTQPFALVQGGDKDISVTNFSNGATFHGILSDLKVYNTVITP
jgi:hypothetical protein